MNKEIIKRSMQEYKYPAFASKSSYVGIEIEFMCPYSHDYLAEKLIEAKLHNYVTLGDDGSIRTLPGHRSYECRVLVREAKLSYVISKLCKLLDEVGAEVNDSCGLHVHLDMRNRNASKAYNNLVRSQALLFAIADETRSHSHWCFPQTFHRLSKANRGKSCAIAPHLRPDKNTLEVRIREGILDGQDILQWAKLLISIVNAKKLTKTSICSVEDAKKRTSLTRNMVRYIQEKLHDNSVGEDFKREEVA